MSVPKEQLDVTKLIRQNWPEIQQGIKAGTNFPKTKAAITDLITRAKIEENEYWDELSKAFKRGVLPIDFADRINELKRTLLGEEDKNA